MIDGWLLGHIHQRYPDKRETAGEKIFMPGTPETEQLIKKEFSPDSISYRLLESLLEEDDTTLQLAYNLIRGVQE